MKVPIPACLHPLVIDEPADKAAREAGFGTQNMDEIRRRCLLCGIHYQRTEHLKKMRDAIRARYRVTSPWSSGERSDDCLS